MLPKRHFDEYGHFVFNNGGCQWPEGTEGGTFFRWRVTCRGSMQLGRVLEVGCLEPERYTSHVTPHTSHLTHHTSRLIRSGYCKAVECECSRSFNLRQRGTTPKTTCKSHLTHHTSHITTSHIKHHTSAHLFQGYNSFSVDAFN